MSEARVEHFNPCLLLFPLTFWSTELSVSQGFISCQSLWNLTSLLVIWFDSSTCVAFSAHVCLTNMLNIHLQAFTCCSLVIQHWNTGQVWMRETICVKQSRGLCQGWNVLKVTCNIQRTGVVWHVSSLMCTSPKSVTHVMPAMVMTHDNII